MFDLENMPFDPDEFPFGVNAGDNKFGFKKCPGCGSEGYAVPVFGGEPIQSFAFRDWLSAAEYRISGLCQSCQDDVFDESDDLDDEEPL